MLMLTGLAGGGPPAREPAWAALLLGATDALRDRKISKSHFICPRTASELVGNILAKLGVGSHGDDAVFAIRHALV